MRRGNSSWYLHHWKKALGNEKDLIVFNFHGEGRAQINKAALVPFTLLNNVLIEDDYKTLRTTTGGYNYRTIAGSDRFSVHSYGLAVDINWKENPVTRNGICKTTFSPGTIEKILEIKTKKGIQVFRWGGNYKSYKDPMHFEIMVTPEELDTNLERDSYKVEDVLPIPANTKVNLPLKIGDRGDNVIKVQKLLNEKIQANLTTDGDFGKLTLAAVVTFQKLHSLTQDGIVGPITFSKLIEKNIIKKKKGGGGGRAKIL